MGLKNILSDKRSAVLKRWFDKIVETYPQDASGHLRKQKAQFANPVGYTITEGIEGLYESLLTGLIPDEVATLLDGIVRIRAVQDFTPSEAVSFIFMLKKAVREELRQEISQQAVSSEELTAFEATVDDLALYAFDLYMKCREKIYEIKANEARSATFRLLQKAGILAENQT